MKKIVKEILEWIGVGVLICFGVFLLTFLLIVGWADGMSLSLKLFG